MFINIASLTLFVYSLASVQALPVWLRGKKNTATIVPDPKFLGVDHPHFNQYSTPFTIQTRWKYLKDDAKKLVTETHDTLGLASTLSTRPSLQDLGTYDTRPYLITQHAKLKGMVEFFASEKGKESDPDGRRIVSAHDRLQMLEQVHEDAQHLHNWDANWAESKTSISESMARTDESYRLASEKKKSRFRAKYGDHVKNTYNGHPAAPFVSSKDAKEREAQRAKRLN